MHKAAEEKKEIPNRGWRIDPKVVAILDSFVKNARHINMPVKHHHVVAAALRQFFFLPPARIRDLLNREIGTASAEFDSVVDGAKTALKQVESRKEPPTASEDPPPASKQTGPRKRGGTP